jgi:Lon protease-like protein
MSLTHAALSELPLFPLPGTVLIPGTFISLHIFEPRYRRMIEDCVEGHRCLAIAMLDENGQADLYARPPVFRVAGAGVLRRSARLPDGRFNVVLEGVARVDISDEHPPSRTYRRARARILENVMPANTSRLDTAVASLRALTSRVLATLDSDRAEALEGLAELEDAGQLADMIAAAALKDEHERQRVLSAINLLERVELVAGALGTLLLEEEIEPARGWGVTLGEA